MYLYVYLKVMGLYPLFYNKLTLEILSGGVSTLSSIDNSST